MREHLTFAFAIHAIQSFRYSEIYIYINLVSRLLFEASNLRNGWIIFNETLHTPYGDMRIGFKFYYMFRYYTKLNLIAIF